MKTLMLIILCLGIALPAVADDMMDEIVAERDGRKALLFNFNGLNLSSFEGGIGTKWWLSGSTAMVGNLILANRGTQTDANEDRSGRESTDLTIGAALGVEKHLAHFGRFSPYFGVNLGYRYSYYLTESTPPTGVERRTLTNKRESNGVSLGIVFGVECFVTKHVSVGGQYKLAAEYAAGQEEYNGNVQDFTEHRLGIGSSYVSLAIYF